MNASITNLIALITVVTSLTVAYGKAFAVYQTQISQWVIDAGRVPARRRGIVNLAVGVVIAGAFTVIGALAIGRPAVIPVEVLAGVFASVEAARLHDAAAARPAAE